MQEGPLFDHGKISAFHLAVERFFVAWNMLDPPIQVQGLQIDAAFNSVDAWNAQQESAIIMG